MDSSSNAPAGDLVRRFDVGAYVTHQPNHREFWAEVEREINRQFVETPDAEDKPEDTRVDREKPAKRQRKRSARVAHALEAAGVEI